MSEIASPEISVAGLLDNLREEVARRKANTDHPSSLPPSRPDESFPPLPPARSAEAEPFRLQPPFVSRADGCYQIHDLTQYHDATFVRNAYRAILRRSPDEEGFRGALENLRSGRLNKIDILAGLLLSPEGKAGGVEIEGLQRSLFLRRLGRLPLVGYPLRVLITLARLPHLVRHHQQLEAYTAMQDQHLAEQTEYVKGQLQNTVAEMDRRYERMRDFERRVRQFTEETTRSFETQKTWAAEQDRRLDGHDDRLGQHSIRLGEIETGQRAQDAQLQSLALQFGERLSELRREVVENLLKLQAARRELTAQGRRLSVLLEGDARSPSPASPSLDGDAGKKDDHFYDAFYASFEDLFRGTREDIKMRLRVHLATLTEAGVGADVLDLGCGRGEWLELLGDNQISAKGVDLNRVFVEECRTLNLDVSEQDAVAYLRSLADDTLGAVTSFHLIEHLPFETLVEMIDEILRVLRPGGVVIFETPNPENFSVGSYFFYTDPTHRNPLPSQTMRFVMESRGFSQIQVSKLHPAPEEMRLAGDAEIVKRFNEYFYGPFDYAIVGRKI
ncbi:MAG TPA: methyltransferase domain-containing protein [Pyrinomonadaceae bacterium]|nr:methyltransferase domain-containing protein [Pyrinomonadaceae bacterium]